MPAILHCLALFKKANTQPAPVAKAVRSVKDLSNDARLSMTEGQRLYVAKDYPGAAILVPYFLLTLFVMWLTDPYGRG